ncbi:TlpA family protein disulfide reductase [bacterium]|nr:TlpA family protein disulfide reductase [bacterium]
MKIKKLIIFFLTISLVMVLGLIALSCSSAANNTNKNTDGYANNFTLYDLNKNKVSLSDFQGKIVVLNFWASWCPPCVQEAPDFAETYNSYKAKGVQFLGISNDDVNALEKFIKDKNIGYPTLIDGSIDKIMPKWGINALPTTFILGRNGEILFHNVGLMTKDQLISSIEKSLNS